MRSFNLSEYKIINSFKGMLESNFYLLKNSIFKKSPRDRKLIAHFTHHKCGTVWFERILKKISYKFALKYQSCEQDFLREDTNIWMQFHSIVDFKKLPPYVGTHMIRDPRDIVISAYFYHLWCDEDWCRVVKEEYNNLSYQEYLKSLPQDEGILFEMTNNREKGNSSGAVINDIARWDYSNPDVMELKYEDVLLYENEMFNEIFTKYGFNKEEKKISFNIVKKYRFENITKRKLGQEKEKTHLRKGIPGDWKNFFSDIHKIEFKKLYGDLLIKLGYENDNNW